MNNNTQDNTQALVKSMGFMEGSLVRQNANGGRLGRTLSYIQSCPAGDIKKHLAATGLKGKALKAAVSKVLRGDADMAWVIYESQVSVARSMGYVPVRSQTNKAEDVITTRFEKMPPTPEEVAKAAAASLPAKELVSLAMARMSDEELLKLIKESRAASDEDIANANKGEKQAKVEETK